MRTLLTAAVMLGCFAAGAADVQSVDLTIDEASGVARKAWPVTAGVPFAKGQLKNVQSLKLSSSDGKPLPLETYVSAKWLDGSVKWALLDTQVDLAANASTKLKLSWNGAATTAAASQQKLAVTQENGGVRVDTGAISFRVTPTGGGVPEDVKAGALLISKGGTHEMSYVAAGPPPNTPEMRGNWKRPAPPDTKPLRMQANGAKATVSIEQQNALRATVLVKGWYQLNGQEACRFDVRITAFVGKPYVRIQHTFTYTEDPNNFFVRSVRYRVAMEGVERAAFAGTAPAMHEVSTAGGAYLLYAGPEINHNGILPTDAAAKRKAGYEVFANGSRAAAGEHPGGYVAVQGAAGGVALSLRDLKYLHPKALVADATGVEAGLWPEQGNLLIDCRNPLYGQRIRGETTLGGMACGWAKTHEMWISYHSRDAAAAKQALDTARAAQEPAWAAVDPRHVCDSGAIGVLAPVDRTRYPGLERQHETLFAWLRKNQEVFRWDGFFDYGDVLIEFDNHPQRHSGGARGTWVWRDYAGWILNDGQLVHQLFRAYVRSGERTYMKMAEACARRIGDETTVHHFNAKVNGAHPLGASHRHDMSPWGSIVTTYGMDVMGNCDLWYLTGDLRSRDNLRDYADNLTKGGPGLKEHHALGSLLCRIGEALEDPALIEAGKKAMPMDLREAAQPGFRTPTDTIMPMILALDITNDDALKKGLIGAADSYSAKGDVYGTEAVAWAYLSTKDAKYLEGLKRCLALYPNISAAASANGNPWTEDWAALRNRMNQMPAWFVKVYINLQYVGRYPSAIRALQTASLEEKALNLK